MTRPTSLLTRNGSLRLLRILFAAIPISGYGCTGAGRRAQWAIRGCISVETAKFCSLTVLFGLEYCYAYSTSAEDLAQPIAAFSPAEELVPDSPGKWKGLCARLCLL